MSVEPTWYTEHLAAFAGPRSRSTPRPAGSMPAQKWAAWWAQQALLADPIMSLASEQGFVLHTAQLGGLGVTRSAARHALRVGRWYSPMRGFIGVVDVGSDDAPEPERARRKHSLASAAAALSRPGLVVSGRSAAILHGLPTVRIPRLAGLTGHHHADRAERGAAHLYAAGLEPASVSSWFGIPVTSAARTVVDVARHSRDDGIAVADAALREQLVTRALLAAELDTAYRWPGVVSARDVVRLADPRAESLLESVLRLRMHDDAFPDPSPQYAIAGYFTDLALVGYGLVVEADGRIKYTADDGPDDALWREKKRETAIRRDGWWVERVVRSDLFGRWPATSHRLRTQLRPGFRPIGFT